MRPFARTAIFREDFGGRERPPLHRDVRLNSAIVERGPLRAPVLSELVLCNEEVVEGGRPQSHSVRFAFTGAATSTP
jgi:hypothetical protein